MYLVDGAAARAVYPRTPSINEIEHAVGRHSETHGVDCKGLIYEVGTIIRDTFGTAILRVTVEMNLDRFVAV